MRSTSRRVEIEVPLPGLPLSFDGYRILQISDTHLDVLPELVAAARHVLAGVEVDLLALTGDIHGTQSAPIAYSVELLMQALQDVRVRGPRLAILGNHDPVEMAALLEEKGFDVLVNRSQVIERGGERLRVTGLDDVHNFYTDAARAAFHDHADNDQGANAASPSFIPPKWPMSPTRRAMHSISPAIHMPDRSACPEENQ